MHPPSQIHSVSTGVNLSQSASYLPQASMEKKGQNMKVSVK